MIGFTLPPFPCRLKSSCQHHLHVLQAIYVTYNPDGDTLKLPYCIILFGGFQFIMSQLPDMHSLRFMNCISNVMTLTFCAIAVGMSVHNGECCNTLLVLLFLIRLRPCILACRHDALCDVAVRGLSYRWIYM